MTPQNPSLFDAAAELVALASGKPLSQVRLELGPAPRASKCNVCKCRPCACNGLAGRCQVHDKPLALTAGGRGFTCIECP